MPKRKKPLDLTNKRFGNITALQRILKAKPPQWICQCDSGHKFPIRTVSLTQGQVTTCPVCTDVMSEDIEQDIADLEKDIEEINAQKKEVKPYDGIDTMDSKLDDMVSQIAGLSNKGISEEVLKEDNALSSKVVELPKSIEISGSNLENDIYIAFRNKMQTVKQWSKETDIPIQTIMSRLYSKWSIPETFEDAN